MKLMFSFLLLVFSICVIRSHAIGSKCIADQQVALLNMKKSLVFNAAASPKLVTWDSSKECCSWLGVTCSNDGRVIGLDISSESISGGIDNSSSLFHLQHLQSLNLADNLLGSVGSKLIPSAIGRFEDLRYLNLSHNFYSGQIPIQISYLTRMVILDISYSNNRFEIIESPNLNTLLQNLTELTELYLDGVQIGREWGQAISSSLPNLRVLSLSNCGLSGPIHKSLAKLQSVSVIQLGWNPFSASFPAFFTNFSNLSFLGLRDSYFRGVVPKEIFQLPSLQDIDLSDNAELRGTLPEFAKNGSLRSLVLSGSNFSGSLPNSIGNPAELSMLDVSRCNFTGQLPKSMANLTQLLSVDMFGNNFRGSIPTFNSAMNLERLDLAYNSLTGNIHGTNWGNLSSLIFLRFRQNMLEGNIPSTLFSLTIPNNLNLYDNQFSGQFPEVSNDSSYFLRTLSLGRNNLEGPIPMSIFNFRGLVNLDLASNNFSGSFALDGFQHQRELTALDLSYNNIFLSYDATNFSYQSFPQFQTLSLASGNLRTFPVFLRNQSQLSHLDLSDNHILGEVPNWIWKLKYLVSLNLSCNSFDTLKASSVSNLTTLIMLDLHSNKFQGQVPTLLRAVYMDYSRNGFNNIPTTIGDSLLETAFISLSNNNLHGLIPESICKSNFLEVLDLSNNFLSGAVPQCLPTMANLAVLILRRNNLTSVGILSKNCILETLDISKNRIKGHFLESLVNCRKLEVLNLGNNQIAHPFPCFLKNTSTLRVLVLRSNMFYGHIGCPETNGTWPVLQIIDLAHNNFSGEIPANALVTWQAMMGKQYDAPLELNHLQFQDRSYDIYYQDTVTLVNKGLEMELIKILRVFTSIDFSCNTFEGPIPKEIGAFKSLYALNLSNNAFTGAIPASFSGLSQLEALDLSKNNLSGKIPPQLTRLTFLSFLNLSCNQLVGRIPSGNQFSTFTRDSFEGNKGLFGPPLTGEETSGLSPPPADEFHAKYSRDLVDWDIISVEVGFISGFGIVIVTPLFCKRWRKWYQGAMYNILVKLFPRLEGRIST